jgi:hypothetical protein
MLGYAATRRRKGQPVFYILIFASLAVLVIVTVVVQRSRRG